MEIGGDRVTTVVSLLGVTVGIIALVLGIVAITKQPGMQTVQQVPASGGSTSDGQGQGQGQSQAVMSPPPRTKRVWLIGAGHDWGAHEYFDTEGYIKGFSFDLIKAVCDAGGMDCRSVWMPYTDCFVSRPGEHPYGGQGLHDNWVDACTGWLVTLDRIHIFDFTNSYLTPETSYFHVLSGSSFDTNDLRNKKIGFVAGWYSSEKCLARHSSAGNTGYIMKKENVIHGSTPGDLVNKLRAGEIDAIFAGTGEMDKYMDQGIVRLDKAQLSCAMSGSAMMTRKGSPFIAEWNDAFNKLRANGGFSKLCGDAQNNHQLQGNVECVK